MSDDVSESVRVAIVGATPCGQCTAACCKQNGHAYAAILRGDEVRRFAAFAIDVPIETNGRVAFERVLPYVNGRCRFLGEDDRCTIYEDRPAACRAFACIDHFNREAVGRDGPFLRRNPSVAAMLRAL